MRTTFGTALGWVPGEHHGLAWDGGCALIEGTVPLSTAIAVWSRMESGGDLSSFLQALTDVCDGSLLHVPGFAALMAREGSGHVAVRGSFVLVATSASGDVRCEGQGVTTWAERRLDAIDIARLAPVEPDAAAAGPPAAGDERPLVCGVVPASQLVWQVGSTRDEADPAASSVEAEPAALSAESIPLPPPRPETAVAPPDGPIGPTDDLPESEWGPADAPSGAGEGPAGLADHDGQTIMRGLSPLTSGDGVPGSLAAVLCDAGHVNPPGRSRCRACGKPVGGQKTMVAPGVPIGWVEASSGQSVELTGTIIVGRQPMAARVEGDRMPSLLALPFGHISGSHLEICVEGWAVFARDVNSTNGTFLLRGQEPPRRVPEDRIQLDSGDVLDLGHGVKLTFPEMA